MDDMIAADEVIGTEVFNADGHKLGRVDTIMIDRVSGKSLYVIMTAGGFLGIGGTYYPLPWATLKYDAALNGYIADVDEAVLLKSPSYDRHGQLNRPPEGAPESFDAAKPSAMD